MTSTKDSVKLLTKQAIAVNQKSIGQVCVGALCLSASCLLPVAGLLTFAPSSASAQYGLGLPKSAGTGGATRGELPQITMLAPEDGAKTLAARPTFYWYIAPTSPALASPTSSTVSRNDGSKNSFKIRFYLRDGTEESAKALFVAEGKAEESGLYKFTLPETTPELVKNKVQRWQIRWQTSSGSSQVDVNSPILRDDNPLVLKAIAAAKNDLEKARIYVKNAYWYDAIAAYSNWLDKNPKDNLARTERNNLLKEGFKNHTAFSNEKKDNVAKLLKKLDETKTATAITLQPKTFR